MMVARVFVDSLFMGLLYELLCLASSILFQFINALIRY